MGMGFIKILEYGRVNIEKIKHRDKEVRKQ